MNPEDVLESFVASIILLIGILVFVQLLYPDAASGLLDLVPTFVNIIVYVFIVVFLIVLVIQLFDDFRF